MAASDITFIANFFSAFKADNVFGLLMYLTVLCIIEGAFIGKDYIVFDICAFDSMFCFLFAFWTLLEVFENIAEALTADGVSAGKDSRLFNLGIES